MRNQPLQLLRVANHVDFGDTVSIKGKHHHAVELLVEPNEKCRLAVHAVERYPPGVRSRIHGGHGLMPESDQQLGDGLEAMHGTKRRASLTASIGRVHNVFLEVLLESRKIAVAYRFQESRNKRTLPRSIRLEPWTLLREMAPGTMHKLPDRCRSRFQDRSDLVVLDLEDLAKQERGALRWSQSFQQNHKCHGNGVVTRCGVLRTLYRGGGDGFGQPGPDILLPLSPRRLQAIQAEPRYDFREPGTLGPQILRCRRHA